MKKTLPIIIIVFFALLTYHADAQDYTVHSCKDHHCGVIEFHQHTQQRSGVLDAWTQPIRVSVGIQQGLSVSNEQIASAINEDSNIAISEGLYTGQGPAYILANVFSFSPNELTDVGLPFIMNSVLAAFSTVDFNGNLGTIYDSYVVNNRNCYGTHKNLIIVDDATSGVQEVSSINADISSNYNPTEVFKKAAFLASGGYKTRNHAVTHSAGGNAGSHQDGPEISKRPVQTADGRSYGWSTTGSLGFSGGTALGVGPQGENLAGHVADGHAQWLSILPNLTANIVTTPNALEVNENGLFQASINKDIGNENWSWTFVHNGNTVNKTENPVNVSFSEAGTWTYIAIISNDCGGQTDTLNGSFVVNSSLQAPEATCASGLVLELNSDGSTTLTPAMLDNGSTDPDGSITTTVVNGKSEVIFDCSQTGKQPVTLTVTDNDGLTGSCSTTVEVLDITDPELTCMQDTLIKLSENETFSFDKSDIASAIDNCSTELTIVGNSFSGNNLGEKTISVSVTDDSGNSTLCDITVTVDKTTAVVDINKDNRISVYPNPVQDIFSIQVNDLDIEKISLYSSLGERIREDKLTPNVDISTLPTGMYILMVISKNGESFVQKLVKK